MKLTKRDVQTLALAEDLKYKTDVIFTLHEELDKHIENEKKINELIRQYNIGELTSELLVNHLKMYMRGLKK